MTLIWFCSILVYVLEWAHIQLMTLASTRPKLKAVTWLYLPMMSFFNRAQPRLICQSNSSPSLRYAEHQAWAKALDFPSWGFDQALGLFNATYNQSPGLKTQAQARSTSCSMIWGFELRPKFQQLSPKMAPTPKIGSISERNRIKEKIAQSVKKQNKNASTFRFGFKNKKNVSHLFDATWRSPRKSSLVLKF